MYKGNDTVSYQAYVKSHYDIPETIDNDTFRIMITTDNHIGYKENDAYIELDSFENFVEVMEVCKKLGNVDFMLNSGDLFHENHFSSKNLNFITDLLVKTCLNDNPITFKTYHKPDSLKLNYDDENVNVGLPIFIINGNHDFGNSIGTENVSILKILSNLKLVNYLGNFNINDKEDVEIEPLILKKGSTQLNLYGLSNIKEDRLNKLIRNNKLTFLTNDEVTPKGLNLLLLHQNRSSNLNKNFLNENLLPDFLDLLIWGHEHECIPDLSYNSLKNFNILQPGSTVQTSFHESELEQKCCFLMDFKDNQYTLYPIPLQKVRPMKVRSISLRELNVPKDLDHITKVLVSEVEEMIQEVERDRIERGIEQRRHASDALLNNHSQFNQSYNYDLSQAQETEAKNNLLPLIRLKLDYTGYEDISFRSINNRFIGMVANPNTVLQLSKTYSQKAKRDVKNVIPDIGVANLEKRNTTLSTNDQLVAIIRKAFESDQKLIALDEKNLLEFFSSNLLNSISESKTNLEKFIRKETERSTQVLAERTKNEMKNLSLTNVKDSQFAAQQHHDQPLLANTKDYKKLLKNVTSLLSKQLKVQPSIPSKRERIDDEHEEPQSLISGHVALNNKQEDFSDVSDSNINDNQKYQRPDNINLQQIATSDSQSSNLDYRIVKKPKTVNRFLPSDSDSDVLIDSEPENINPGIGYAEKSASMAEADYILDSQEAHSGHNRSKAAGYDAVSEPAPLNTRHEEPQLIISSSDSGFVSEDDLVVLEENKGHENGISEKHQSASADPYLIQSQLDENQPFLAADSGRRDVFDQRFSRNVPVKSGKDASIKVKSEQNASIKVKSGQNASIKVKSEQNISNELVSGQNIPTNITAGQNGNTAHVRKGPPVRRKKLSISLLSSDSDA